MVVEASFSYRIHSREPRSSRANNASPGLFDDADIIKIPPRTNQHSFLSLATAQDIPFRRGEFVKEDISWLEQPIKNTEEDIEKIISHIEKAKTILASVYFDAAQLLDAKVIDSIEYQKIEKFLKSIGIAKPAETSSKIDFSDTDLSEFPKSEQELPSLFENDLELVKNKAKELLDSIDYKIKEGSKSDNELIARIFRKFALVEILTRHRYEIATGFMTKAKIEARKAYLKYKKYLGGVSLQDIVLRALNAIKTAITRYDPNKGTKPSSWIVNNLKYSLSRSTLERRLYLKKETGLNTNTKIALKRALYYFRDQGADRPSLADIKNRLKEKNGIKLSSEIIEKYLAVLKPRSLDFPADKREPDSRLIDIVTKTDTDSSYHDLSLFEKLQEKINKSSNVPKKQRALIIFALNAGVNPFENQTLTDEEINQLRKPLLKNSSHDNEDIIDAKLIPQRISKKLGVLEAQSLAKNTRMENVIYLKPDKDTLDQIRRDFEIDDSVSTIVLLKNMVFLDPEEIFYLLCKYGLRMHGSWKLKDLGKVFSCSRQNAWLNIEKAKASLKLAFKDFQKEPD